MDAGDQAAVRDGQGRFAPGRSGNPKGKKPGTLNRATAIKAALAGALGDGEAATAARVIIERALKGDFAAARFVIGRVDPKPRGREIVLTLPDDAQPCDVIEAYDATLTAMVTGEITPDEALVVGRFLAQRAAMMGALAASTRGAAAARESLHFSRKMQDAAAAPPADDAREAPAASA